MPLLEEKEGSEIQPVFGDDSEQKQRRQMLIALALLLVALILVLVKDREFWFPSEPAAQSESEPVEEASPDQKPPQAEAATAATPAPVTRVKAKPHTPPPAEPSPAPALAPVVTSRAVLPPLEVEVVAGDEHRTIQPGTASVKVDLQARAPFAPTQAASTQPSSDSSGVADATGRVRINPGAAELLSAPGRT